LVSVVGGDLMTIPECQHVSDEADLVGMRVATVRWKLCRRQGSRTSIDQSSAP
jgi:hypothetical protein